MKPVATVTVILLLFISLAQLVRFVLQVEVVANDDHVPVWASAVACVVFAALETLLRCESRR